MTDKLKQSFKNFKDNFNLKCFILEALLVIAIVAMDLISKDYMFKYLPTKAGNEAGFIDGFMNFVMVKNYGASFGIFQGKTELLLGFTMFSIILLFLIWVFGLRNAEPAIKISILFIFAGGIGNIVDRFSFNYVRDFMNFQFFEFPVFNVADCFVTIGTFLLVISLLIDLFKEFSKGKKKDEQ